ncbi:hypothetical protein [Aquabacterium sp.]|uniref:hypothetical protein n=1 Tax=Aquabacterium sp. TaxID=1872578 RepID=UPI003784B7B8
MSDDTPAPQQLPTELATFIQSGLSITVAGRDDRLVPSIAKGVGCRVGADGSQVTVLVFAEAGEAVLRDIAHNGLIAVVFSLPSSNRTVQLKGRDARLVPANAADVALARRHVALFANELRQLGWQDEYVHAVFWHDPAQLLAVRFTPDGAFSQTPGPGAGAAMCLQARPAP